MTTKTTFSQLGLAPAVLSALTELGYETPTAVQAQSLPILMAGDDLLAQAQTGTGKTAAFALPTLSHLDLSLKTPQALIIAPTRELAIQVAEAFQSYAKYLKGFHVTPIYGGQAYPIQLRALKRGAHVIVGTPGRIMDHLRRGTISMKTIKTVVLDEADEMLKMGFVEDIEWILEQIPHAHQTALFSATMPKAIQNIAHRYLKNAKKVQIKAKSGAVDTIEQFYTRVSRNQKMEVLTRFLEVEEVDAAIIFARTKNCSGELADKLQARGYAAAALNGDMNQSAREKVIAKIKRGALDIVVATDVAARGIDVERVTHVINYDMPHDTESYIHRIGRTGRAGRKGKALLFVTPRERRLLSDIERAVRKPIEQLEPPSVQEMKDRRAKQLSETLVGIVEKSKHLGPFREMVASIVEQTGKTSADIAAAVIYLMQQSNPVPDNDIPEAKPEFEKRKGKPSRFRGKPSGKRANSGNRKPPRVGRSKAAPAKGKARRSAKRAR